MVPRFRCNCQCFYTKLLEGALEYKCCKEIGPALQKMTFNGCIEKISCVTQHAKFEPLLHEIVLENAGSLLRDRNGRAYRSKHHNH